jgi:hypothetical protein
MQRETAILPAIRMEVIGFASYDEAFMKKERSSPASYPMALDEENLGERFHG